LAMKVALRSDRAGRSPLPHGSAPPIDWKGIAKPNDFKSGSEEPLPKRRRKSRFFRMAHCRRSAHATW
jgi:hypothetical protein